MVMVIVRLRLGENHRLRGWLAVKATSPRLKREYVRKAKRLAAYLNALAPTHSSALSGIAATLSFGSVNES
jgi:hypothetical protein